MRGSSEQLSKARIETFSDAIFAIVITLLVLEIRIGEVSDHHSVAAMAEALTKILPKIISLVISFITICVIWINHHRIFTQVRSTDLGFFWINAKLILWVSLIPFPTALIGEYPQNPLALALYGVIMALMALSFVLMRLHVWKHRCIHDDVDARDFKRGTTMATLLGPVAYGIGVLASFISEPIAFAIYLGIPAYFIVPHVARSRPSCSRCRAGKP